MYVTCYPSPFRGFLAEKGPKKPETDWDDKPGLPRLVIPIRFGFSGPFFRRENPETEWDNMSRIYICTDVYTLIRKASRFVLAALQVEKYRRHMVKVRRCRAYVYVWQYVMGLRIFVCRANCVAPTSVSHFTHRLGQSRFDVFVPTHLYTHIYDMMCLMYAHPFARQASLPSARAYGHCPMISAVNMIVRRFRAYVFDKMSWTYVCAFANQTVLPLCLWYGHVSTFSCL